LDHAVVQFPGDPLPIVQHGQALQFALGARVLQRHRSLVGERFDEADFLLLECRATYRVRDGDVVEILFSR
jgi:hypothetical protein